MKQHIQLSVLVMLAIATLLTSLGLPPRHAIAANASDWQAGRIIDDALFTDANSMSVTDIQNFLNNLVPTCDTNGTQPASDWGYPNLTHAQFATQIKGWPGPPYVCLKEYYEVPKTSPGSGMPDNSYNHYDAASGTLLPVPNGVSAAQLIYNAAQQYHISPKVLLVMIEKESAGPLTRDTWPLPNQYYYPLGAHCPDSTGCDPNYQGFSIQISESAALLRYYLDNMTQSWWPYKTLGNNNILYNPNTACGSSTVNIVTSATAALYTYTPYQPNSAALANLYGTGDSCSSYGNRNFWRTYTDWFGGTLLPSVIKSSSDPSIYVQSGGYKFYVPTISVLQDFGLGTGAQIVPQSTLDNIPTGSSSAGLSSSIGIVAQAPNTTPIYLVSAGKRYQFTTTQQMADFGFSSTNISSLPLSLLQSIPSGGTLNNYVKNTDDSSIFQISGDVKQLILNNVTLQSLNTNGSLSIVSGNVTGPLSSGLPLSNVPALVGTPSKSIYLYSNSTYYYIPTPEVLDCWGFMGTLNMSLYPIADVSYIAPIPSSSPSLGCSLSTDQSNVYLLNGTSKISLPASYGFTPPAIPNSDIVNLANKLPTRGQALGQVVASTNSFGIWYLEGGSRKSIPSLTDLQLLGSNTSKIDRLNPGAINALPAAGIKLGTGQVVRAGDTGAIYVITSPTSMSWVGTIDDLRAYGYSQSSMDSSTSTILGQYYSQNSSQLSRYMYTPSGDIYIMDPNGCYGLTSSQATSFGQPDNIAQSGQPYASTIFPYVNLVNCKYASTFVKFPGQGVVYEVVGGVKHPISSWSKLQSLSQQPNPYIINLGSAILASLPTGETY